MPEVNAVIQKDVQKSDHQHNRHVAIGIDVVIRYCTICGLSHSLDKVTNTWILIKEEK